MGFGLTFLHELFHTPIGGNLLDTYDVSSMGETVRKVNIIRRELDTNPLNRILGGNGYLQFGIREFYVGEEVSREKFNHRYDEVLLKVRFTILNEKGKSNEASTKANIIRKK